MRAGQVNEGKSLSMAWTSNGQVSLRWWNARIDYTKE
jgi:hypothetical protein